MSKAWKSWQGNFHSANPSSNLAHSFRCSAVPLFRCSAVSATGSEWRFPKKQSSLRGASFALRFDRPAGSAWRSGFQFSRPAFAEAALRWVFLNPCSRMACPGFVLEDPRSRLPRSVSFYTIPARGSVSLRSHWRSPFAGRRWGCQTRRPKPIPVRKAPQNQQFASIGGSMTVQP